MSKARHAGWLLAVVLVITAAPHAVPDEAARAAELAAIRGEIARLERRLESMQTRQSSLEDELERLGVELALQEQQLAEATAARDLADQKAARAAERIADLRLALQGVRQDLRKRLVGLYRLGRHGYLRLFLSLDPDRELLPAIRQLRFLVRRDREALDRYAVLRDELTAEGALLLSEQEAMAAWERREAERRDSLRTLEQRQQQLLERVNRERRALAAQTDALQDKARKLSSFIDSLLGNSPTALSGTPIQRFQGVLDWPAAGEVSVRFGARQDPRYRTEVPHNGIDIETGAAEVQVIFPGEVLYASHFEGYGRMVVVHHPGRVFTLYAGLEALQVDKGDVLSLGDVLGRSTGTLYFEVRSGNQPEDPLTWLR